MVDKNQELPSIDERSERKYPIENYPSVSSISLSQAFSQQASPEKDGQSSPSIFDPTPNSRVSFLPARSITMTLTESGPSPPSMLSQLEIKEKIQNLKSIKVFEKRGLGERKSSLQPIERTNTMMALPPLFKPNTNPLELTPKQEQRDLDEMLADNKFYSQFSTERNHRLEKLVSKLENEGETQFKERLLKYTHEKSEVRRK